MSSIDFRTAAYFSLPFHLVAAAFDLFGLIALLEGVWWLAVLLWVVSLLVFTTHYRLQLDLSTKTYHDYLWVLGMKIGEKGSFDGVEYVFIKKAKVSQTVHARVASTTIEKEVCDAYLKFSNGTTLHLFTKDSREAVLQKLKKIAEQLKTEIIDYTQGEAKVV